MIDTLRAQAPYAAGLVAAVLVGLAVGLTPDQFAVLLGVFVTGAVLGHYGLLD